MFFGFHLMNSNHSTLFSGFQRMEVLSEQLFLSQSTYTNGLWRMAVVDQLVDNFGEISWCGRGKGMSSAAYAYLPPVGRKMSNWRICLTTFERVTACLGHCLWRVNKKIKKYHKKKASGIEVPFYVEIFGAYNYNEQTYRENIFNKNFIHNHKSSLHSILPSARFLSSMYTYIYLRKHSMKSFLSSVIRVGAEQIIAVTRPLIFRLKNINAQRGRNSNSNFIGPSDTDLSFVQFH